MGNNKSFWLDNFETENFKSLDEDIKTEVCIIGGGITGISTAYYLSKKGIDVVILEKDFISSKTTGCTTGKLSIGHGLIYKYLIDSNGIDYAKKYAEANSNAIENIKQIISNENIECEFEEKNAYIYTTDPKEYKSLQEESEACKNIGLDIDFVQKMNLPIMIQGAIKFKNQAQFNPIKYVNGVCESLIKNGVSIYENSKVVGYEKNNGKFLIKVDVGKDKYFVTAENIVVATRYPIFNFPGMYFIKNYQELEYAMCVELKENLEDIDMYLEIGDNQISYRSVVKDEKRYLFAVGNGAKTGEKVDINEYSFLKECIGKVFGKYNILNKWVAEDVISLDKIPYIGRYSKFEPKMYVATGFKKWGMTTSNIAAQIIADKISNEKNKYLELFESTRINPIKNKEEMKNMISTTCDSLLNKKMGDKICTHLGGRAIYNQTTNTWDCPCHGSRYEKDGKLIDGPSLKNLANK